MQIISRRTVNRLEKSNRALIVKNVRVAGQLNVSCCYCIMVIVAISKANDTPWVGRFSLLAVFIDTYNYLNAISIPIRLHESRSFCCLSFSPNYFSVRGRSKIIRCASEGILVRRCCAKSSACCCLLSRSLQQHQTNNRRPQTKASRNISYTLHNTLITKRQ